MNLYHRILLLAGFIQYFRYEEIQMTHLKNITHKHVLDKDVGTHVVSAILYGAQAVFLFESKYSSHTRGSEFMLAAGQGAELELRVEGPQEKPCLKELIQLIEDK